MEATGESARRDDLKDTPREKLKRLQGEVRDISRMMEGRN